MTPFVLITMLCLSNSMGDVVDCGDVLYTTPVNFTRLDTGVWGDIYVYEDEYVRAKYNSYVVHRLLYTFDNYAVFRGDNNDIMEVVPKENIKYKVQFIKKW